MPMGDFRSWLAKQKRLRRLRRPVAVVVIVALSFTLGFLLHRPERVVERFSTIVKVEHVVGSYNLKSESIAVGGFTAENKFTLSWRLQNIPDDRHPDWRTYNLNRVWGSVDGEGGYRLTFDTGPIDIPLWDNTPWMTLEFDLDHFNQGENYPIALSALWADGTVIDYSPSPYATFSIAFSPVAWEVKWLSWLSGVGYATAR